MEVGKGERKGDTCTSVNIKNKVKIYTEPYTLAPKNKNDVQV